MRGFLFCITLVCALFYNLIAQPSAHDVFRIGGMELPPYCTGCLLTQPHQQIDSPILILKTITPACPCGWADKPPAVTRW